MADYGGEYGGAQLSHGISSGMGAVAEAIKRMQLQHQKTKAQLDQLQGLLDGAKMVTVTDPKTGQPKQLFTPDQIQFVQQALNQKNAELAGGRAAALGIGKNVLQRAAAANVAAQGPKMFTSNGIVWTTNPKTGALSSHGPVRNEEGQTKGQQVRTQLETHKAVQAANKSLDAQLKAVGTNRQALFDPGQQQPGWIVDGKFVSAKDYGYDPSQYPSLTNPDGTAKPPTHTLIGYREPTFTQAEGVNAKGQKYMKPVQADKGDPGALVSNDHLQNLQDDAADLAPPVYGPDGNVYSVKDALGYLRSPEAAKQDPALIQKSYQNIMQAVTQGGASAVNVNTNLSTGSSTPTQSSTATAPVADSEDSTDNTDTADEDNE